MCPIKIYDVDRKRSNEALATIVMMLFLSGHKQKITTIHLNSRYFLAKQITYNTINSKISEGAFCIHYSQEKITLISVHH